MWYLPDAASGGVVVEHAGAVAPRDVAAGRGRRLAHDALELDRAALFVEAVLHRGVSALVHDLHAGHWGNTTPQKLN